MGKILTVLSAALLLTGYSVIVHPVETVAVHIDIPKAASPPMPYRRWNLSYPVSNKELECLALNIYFEARGEDPDGQFAVADIVMHRVNHTQYPNTICGVVKEGRYTEWNTKYPIKHKCHFSWYCDRKSDVPTNTKAYKEATYVADVVLNDPDYIPVIEYGIFYHARYVSPEWAENKKMIADIGNHLFY